MKHLPENIYFVGAGGIGMANLVRYCLSKGRRVGGYDRTRTDLTDALEAEGASLVFDDDPAGVPQEFLDPAKTLVVYTPAVPEDNRILKLFRASGHEVVKRAALLGRITDASKGVCVAGSHGKTTTCSMIANILNGSEVGCNAFLGGILRNTGSNLILSETSPYSVVEADEYDRSFHHLHPFIAVVTSTDPDHLDIYGDEEHYLEAFTEFTRLIRPDGRLIVHTGLKFKPEPAPSVKVCTYSGSDTSADYHAENIRFLPGRLIFDFVGPDIRIDGLEPGIPVEINIDNAVAACTAAHFAGATEDEIRRGIDTFMGAKRRFEFHLKPADGGVPVLLDDYAHSPNEVKASIASVRRLYPGRRISVIFQPHLYTRTRDFAPEFAEALNTADEVILTEIYPARELPIEGVSSKLILDGIEGIDKTLVERKNLLGWLKNRNFEILMTLGAADIDRLLPDIREILAGKSGEPL